MLCRAMAKHTNVNKHNEKDTFSSTSRGSVKTENDILTGDNVPRGVFLASHLASRPTDN